MYKTLVYPYDIEFSPILRHNSLLKNISIVKIVSPVGWGYSGKDAAIADGGSYTGMIVESNFDKALEACDTLLIADSFHNLDFYNIILPNILKAARQKKKVIITRALNKDEKAAINTISNDYFININPESDISVIDKMACNNRLFEIDVPVVFILGNTEQSSKFEIQLSIRDELLKMGYRVSQIGSRQNCEMLGFHSMPSFMYDTTVSDDIKIVLFNHYIKNIEDNENPELILVGIPGGVMRINNRFTNRFGLMAYEISQSVSPDFTIFSSIYEDYNEKYFENISDGVERKLEYNIDCHIISNNMIDWFETNEVEDICYLTLDTNFVQKKLSDFKGYNKTIFNIYQKDAAKNICNNFCSNLYNNAYLKSM